ncbi:MAG: NAD(P)-binding protein [Deinococcales bacterium]
MQPYQTYDLIIIGTGAGGGTLAYALKDSGAKILLLERGDFLPQEVENWQVEAVFKENRYKPQELWYSQTGEAFKPGVHYYVGGNTKVYGAALPRFRREDFEVLEHEGGISPPGLSPMMILNLTMPKLKNSLEFTVKPVKTPPSQADLQTIPFPPCLMNPISLSLLKSSKPKGCTPFPIPWALICGRAAAVSAARPVTVFPVRS